MEKPDSGKKTAPDRRQNYARRLQMAVRRAHDPLFTRLKGTTQESRNVPKPR